MNLWLKAETGKLSQVLVHVLFHSSTHLCLEKISFIGIALYLEQHFHMFPNTGSK